MINNRKYSEKELENILKSLTILVDTREKKNEHIIDWFEKKNISYKSITMDSGDYSCMIPKSDNNGIFYDMYFDSSIVIERKNSLEELSGCFSQNRDRFNNEWCRCKSKRKHLLIENATYEDLVNGNYNTDYNKKSFLASLHSFNIKYDLQIMFIKDKSYSPIYILGVMQYYIRYLLK